MLETIKRRIRITKIKSNKMTRKFKINNSQVQQMI